MHCLAPYFVRCFDPNTSKELAAEERYNQLNRIGQYDIYLLLEEFISLHKEFTKVDLRQETYRFSTIKKDAQKRMISGWMLVGNYGIKNDIINVEDNQIAFNKEENHADVRKFYFSFYLPVESKMGIFLMYTYKSSGVKSLFLKEFNNFFSGKTSKNVQINPLTYEKAIQPWLNAETKEIKVVGFRASKDLAEQVATLGDVEFEYSIKAKRNGTLGKLSNFIKKGTSESGLIEVLNSEGNQVKALVAMNGSKKTFRVGHSSKSALCQIEIDEDDVRIIGGSPDFNSLHSWASGIMNDIRKTVGV